MIEHRIVVPGPRSGGNVRRGRKFGKPGGKAFRLPEHREKARRHGRLQRAQKLPSHTFGRQRGHGIAMQAARFAHDLQRLRRHAPVRPGRRKARHPKNPQRILHERLRRYGPQLAAPHILQKIGMAVQTALRVEGRGVHREIAGQHVLFNIAALHGREFLRAHKPYFGPVPRIARRGEPLYKEFPAAGKGNIHIVGRSPQQKIAHRAAHHIPFTHVSPGPAAAPHKLRRAAFPSDGGPLCFIAARAARPWRHHDRFRRRASAF